MIEVDKDLVCSESFKAGKRIYYLDVKQSRNGDRYIAITESKKIVTGPVDAPHITFEKHKVFLYREDFDKFTEALKKVLDVACEVPAREFTPKVYNDSPEGQEAQEVQEVQEVQEAPAEEEPEKSKSFFEDFLKKF